MTVIRSILTRLLLTLAAALIAGPSWAQAPAASATWGAVDFGARTTRTTGDAARYERYRDMSDGLFLETADLTREWNRWLLDIRTAHVGRRDQRLSGTVSRPGVLKAWVMWDQIPMLMSNTTQTLFSSTSAGVLEIENALQAQVQAQAAILPSLFATNSRTFETRSQRDLFETGVEYLPTRALTLRGQVRRTMRDGTIPYGASFGHSSLVELPAPVMHTTNDVEGTAEYERDRLLLRAGYSGSWFHNEVTELTFDSPFRLTDVAATPSHGRLSLAPSNSFVGVNGLATIKLPWRSRATASVSAGWLKDAGAPLMPQTINSATTTIAPVTRASVNGEAGTSSVNLSFVSRPSRSIDLSMRYRSYGYDNRTHEFEMTQRVSYDNAPAAATMGSLGGVTSTPVHSEPFSVSRHAFDADAVYNMQAGFSAGVGYSRLFEDRTHRIIEGTTDNVVRLTFDAVGNSWFSLRTKYEHGARRGEATDDGMRELFRIGEQPGIRHFDVAARNRDRFTVLGVVTPAATWSVNASAGAGQDDYIESQFGLRDNRHRIFAVGVDFIPVERISLNGSYTFERYQALSRSRQANPPAANAAISLQTYLVLSSQPNPGVQVADASRNWATDSLDRAHSVLVSLQIGRIAGKLDVSLDYDVSHARSNYAYLTGAVPDRTLPEEVIVDSVLPTPTELPQTLSQLHRGTADFVYSLTPRIGIGLSVWHEQYVVSDFTLDTESTPNLARGSALLMGYLYRPYTATTVWARLLYRW